MYQHDQFNLTSHAQLKEAGLDSTLMVSLLNVWPNITGQFLSRWALFGQRMVL